VAAHPALRVHPARRAAELYIATYDDSYYAALNATALTASVPAWGNVQGLAWISLAHNLNRLTAAADKVLIKKNWITWLQPWMHAAIVARLIISPLVYVSAATQVLTAQ
jgi:hypothetical protein